MMECKIIKILAIGSTRRFMWLVDNVGQVRIIRISNEFYYCLKSCGVPTAQSLRKKVL